MTIVILTNSDIRLIALSLGEKARRIIICIRARRTTNMRRDVDNNCQHRRSRHLLGGRLEIISNLSVVSEFPSVRIKLQISGPLQ